MQTGFPGDLATKHRPFALADVLLLQRQRGAALLSKTLPRTICRLKAMYPFTVEEVTKAGKGSATVYVPSRQSTSQREEVGDTIAAKVGPGSWNFREVEAVARVPDRWPTDRKPYASEALSPPWSASLTIPSIPFWTVS